MTAPAELGTAGGAAVPDAGTASRPAGLDAPAVELAALEVLVAGTDPSAAAAIAALAAAGVGTLGIVGGEAVGSDDPPRHPLLGSPDVGRNRAEALALRLGAPNERSLLEPYPVGVDEANAFALSAGRDAVVCTHAAAHGPLADACTRTGVALVVVEQAGARGRVSAFASGQGCCWRCALGPLEAGDAEARAAAAGDRAGDSVTARAVSASDEVDGGATGPADAALAAALGGWAALATFQLLGADATTGPGDAPAVGLPGHALELDAASPSARTVELIRRDSGMDCACADREPR